MTLNIEDYRLKPEDLEPVCDDTTSQLYGKLDLEASTFAAEWQSSELKELGKLPDPNNQFEWDEWQEKRDWVVAHRQIIKIEQMMNLICKEIEIRDGS